MQFIMLTELATMSWDKFTVGFKERSSSGPHYVSEEGSTQKPKIFDSQAKGHKGWGRCAKCGRTHDGICREEGRGYFNCG